MTRRRSIAVTDTRDTDPPDDWRTQAACRGKSEAFYPNPTDDMGIRAAQNICNTQCPVRSQCLTEILAIEARLGPPHVHGVAGGLSEMQRRSELRRRKRLAS